MPENRFKFLDYSSNAIIAMLGFICFGIIIILVTNKLQWGGFLDGFLAIDIVFILGLIASFKVYMLLVTPDQIVIKHGLFMRTSLHNIDDIQGVHGFLISPRILWRSSEPNAYPLYRKGWRKYLGGQMNGSVIISTSNTNYILSSNDPINVAQKIRSLLKLDETEFSPPDWMASAFYHSNSSDTRDSEHNSDLG